MDISLDSENMRVDEDGTKTKVKFSHKHTAEYNFDHDIEFIEDEVYNTQVFARIVK